MPRNIDALNVRIVNNKLKAQRLKVNEWKRGCVYLVYLVLLSLILWIGSELRWNLMLPMEQFPRSTGRVALEVSR